MSRSHTPAKSNPNRWQRSTHRGIERRGQRRLTPAYVPAKRNKNP